MAAADKSKINVNKIGKKSSNLVVGITTNLCVLPLFPLFVLIAASSAFENVKGTGANGGGQGNGGLTAAECPHGCECSSEPLTSLDCSGLDLDGIPPTWPTHIQRLVIRNWTISTLEKNTFRRFAQLRELHVLECAQLDLIDRHAFKQLKKLRTLTIRGNKNLRELYKASFSGIGNENALSILIKENGIERIRALAFKNAQNLRELRIEERCFELETGALAAISRLDFLTLRGLCSLEPFAFQNSSRVHQLQIVDSALSQLPRNGFAELSHVNQLQIRECRIGRMDPGALAGLFTVGAVQIQSNQIARLSPGWAIGADNLGSLLFSYNTVREPLASGECLRHGAQRFLFTENTLHCSCAIQWLLNAPPEEQWLAENYCGREEAFKALLYFSPAAAGCPSWSPPAPLTTSTAPAAVPREQQRSAAIVRPISISSQQKNGGEMTTGRNDGPRQQQPPHWSGNPEEEPFEPVAHQRRHSGGRSSSSSSPATKIIPLFFLFLFSLLFI